MEDKKHLEGWRMIRRGGRGLAMNDIERGCKKGKSDEGWRRCEGGNANGPGGRTNDRRRAEKRQKMVRVLRRYG